MKRKNLVGLMERYHEHFHLGFALLSLLIVVMFFPSLSLLSATFVAIIGGFVPDSDHLFFIFIYGRHTQYARGVRHSLSIGLDKAIEYVRQNHKKNNFILSHNLLTVFVSFAFFVYSLSHDYALASVFWLSFTNHFIFDIIEDFLALGRLNSNWFLRFSSKLSS
jgi:hypothetical protein